jgi:hypothetical protein
MALSRREHYPGTKKPAFSKTKAGAVALAVFIRRPQAEIKSAQSAMRLDECWFAVNMQTAGVRQYYAGQ